MKSLNEVTTVKAELEKKLIRKETVSAVDIGQSEKKEFIIRIFVNNPAIRHADLGIPQVYKGIPVTVAYRDIVLH